MSEKNRRRFDWHAVTFWASLGVAIVMIGYSQVRKDHRIITIFSDEGRHEMAKYLRYNYPALAVKLGVGGK